MEQLQIIQNKVFRNDETLLRKIALWRLKSEKIVFTNGCFDLLHLGHIDYLSKASDLGSILVLGLNTDASVRTLKGNNRPITNERSRALVLASLRFIDAVVLFDEETPLNLIQTVRPDILVKGSDYTEDQIVGAPFVKSYGGTIKTIDFLDGYSTSDIEKKIRGIN
jgi:rfaE bifunctional protein nucleotidyltransferase chain/domain